MMPFRALLFLQKVKGVIEVKEVKDKCPLWL